MAMATHADPVLANDMRESLAERARAAGLRVSTMELQRADDRQDLVQRMVDTSAAADVLFVVGLDRLVTDITGRTRRTSAVANLNQRRDEMPTLLDVRVVFWVAKSAYASLTDVAWDFCRVMLTIAEFEQTRADDSDEDADDELAGIYREHFSFVWRCLVHLGVRESDLDDVAQDVFVMAARRLADRKELNISVKAWLFGIASRCAKSHHRQLIRRQRKAHALDNAQDSNVHEPRSRYDARALLLSMLDELEHEQREIYILDEIEGVTVNEAAEALHVNVNTLNSRLRVARRKMAALTERVLAEERAATEQTTSQDPPRRTRGTND
ncbi:hypothetical protein DB30_00121 [Enhygromyxa salina]|uniref:RNA polymerase sigma factor n=2 Tax=Enhygromyxa salina TaxID=215803 RepID=A0A0C2DIV1_9BACT|nr:hypothetical protein DB30_00121 [Enhygromyxa salina]